MTASFFTVHCEEQDKSTMVCSYRIVTKQSPLKMKPLIQCLTLPKGSLLRPYLPRDGYLADGNRHSTVKPTPFFMP